MWFTVWNELTLSDVGRLFDGYGLNKYMALYENELRKTGYVVVDPGTRPQIYSVRQVFVKLLSRPLTYPKFRFGERKPQEPHHAYFISINAHNAV